MIPSKYSTFIADPTEYSKRRETYTAPATANPDKNEDQQDYMLLPTRNASPISRMKLADETPPQNHSTHTQSWCLAAGEQRANQRKIMDLLIDLRRRRGSRLFLGLGCVCLLCALGWRRLLIALLALWAFSGVIPLFNAMRISSHVRFIAHHLGCGLQLLEIVCDAVWVGRYTPLELDRRPEQWPGHPVCYWEPDRRLWEGPRLRGKSKERRRGASEWGESFWLAKREVTMINKFVYYIHWRINLKII